MGPTDDEHVEGQIELPGMSSLGGQRAKPEPAPSAIPTRDQTGALLPEMDEESYKQPGLRDRFFSFLTGRPGAEKAYTGDVNAQLIAAYGPSKRDPSRPDTAAIARGADVSRRTAQRWAKGEGMSRKHAEALARRSRQAMTTKRGRARAMAAARASGTAQKPRGRSAITVTGRQGVTSDLEANYRMRETSVGVTDADVAAMQNAWVEGGDKAVMAFLHHHYDEHYADQWHFQNIKNIDWGDSPVY